MNTVYIIGGVRTPIGKTGGCLRSILPEQLAAVVLNETLNRNSLQPEDIDQVIFGNVIGPGGNIARVSVLEAGWSCSLGALTIDSQCASGLSAVQMAAGQIAAGQDLVVAGGVESTSLAPRRQFNPADPRFAGETVYYERAPFSPPSVGNPDIGETAERVAAELAVSRRDMDCLALASHQRASLALKQGLLADVIVPVQSRQQRVWCDECIRPKMSLSLLDRMPPVFQAGGRVTAGNTCLTHDGAAAVLLASERAVKKYRLRPQAVLAGTASCGCNPHVFPLGPVFAIRKLLGQTGLTMAEIDSLEINEAFAVKVLACCRELGYSLEQTNRLGGALAYGHPYGASGAIILLHLLKSLEQTGGRFGIAAIGAVGGLSVAALVEKVAPC